MQFPLVSVILPCYNTELFVEEAITSIIKQSYRNLEIIVIDDCSTDDTGTICLNLSKQDSRIVYVRNEENLKLIETLNLGIRISTGKYIARMDADDIAHTDRIKYQVKALESDINTVICGAGIISLSLDGVTRKRYFALTNDQIRADALFNSPFAHPCILLRKSTIIDNELWFDHRFEFAEDYHLWQRMLKIGDAKNIPMFLLKYRILPKSQTSLGNQNENKRFQVISDIQQMALNEIGIRLTNKEKRFHYVLSLSDHIRKIDFTEYDSPFIKSYFNKILRHILCSNYCCHPAAHYSLGKIYVKIIMLNIRKIIFTHHICLIASRFMITGIYHSAKMVLRNHNSPGFK